MSLTKFTALIAAGAIAAAPVVSAQAATQTAPILVSATVLSYCTLLATPLAFGNYSSAQTDATATLTVTCSTGTPYTIGLDVGTGTGATVAARKMTGTGGSLLTYSIYSDTARSAVWGNTVGTNTVAGTGSGLVQTITAYGRIPAGQFPGAGAYLDTVTATLNY